MPSSSPRFDVTSSINAQPEIGEQVGYNAALGQIFEVKDKDGNVLTETFAAKADDGSLIAVKKATTATAANAGFVAVTYDSNGATAGGVANATLVFASASATDFANGNVIIAGKNSSGVVVDTGVALTGTLADNGGETDTSAMAAASLAVGGLARLDEALKTVDTLRSDLGAIQNRFQSAITNLQTNSTNLQAARSRIEDADYATEVSNMTRAQILQQAGTSVLAQANQVPQGVLSLLR